MEEVKTKIDVIEALLASHTEFPNKVPQERFADLKDEHPKKPLLTFLEYSKPELKELLKEQTELLQEQQKKENLILAQGKGGGIVCDCLLSLIYWVYIFQQIKLFVAILYLFAIEMPYQDWAYQTIVFGMKEIVYYCLKHLKRK